MSIYTDYTRSMLASITPDVRQHVAGVKLRDAWVYRVGKGHWEFHFREFYWHGSADDAFEARFKGWDAYLRKIGAPGYEIEGSAQ